MSLELFFVPADQYIIFACEEGIYTFNLNQIHEGVMDQVKGQIPQCHCAVIIRVALLSSRMTQNLLCFEEGPARMLEHSWSRQIALA